MAEPLAPEELILPATRSNAGDALPYRPAGWTDRLRRAVHLPELPAPVTVRDGSGSRPRADHRPAIIMLRWFAIVVTVVLASAPVIQGERLVGWCGAALIAHHILRIARPVDLQDDTRAEIGAFAEMLLAVLAVLFTGVWSSPLMACLVAAATIIAFERGFGATLRLVVTTVIALLAALLIGDTLHWEEINLALQWASVLLLMAVVSGYARRVSSEVVKDHSLTLDRVDRLADANQLLTSLHRVAQTMSTSLDQGEVVDKTFLRLRALIDSEVSALLVFDETDAQWEVLRCEGARLPQRLGPTELPPPLRQAVTTGGLVLVHDLIGRDGPGVAASTSSGLYTPLTARGQIIGLIALERAESRGFTGRDIDLLNGLVHSVALGLDNARVFRRIRTVGADEERTRIARDLHDRMGQSLAYLAFELDRLTHAKNVPTDIQTSISGLSDDVRNVIREVRDTLYDLRTDVSENRDMSNTLEDYLERVENRSGLSYELDCDGDDRLPLNQEREFWRIAQEAVRNVERHADAENVTVRYRCDGRRATVEITDDGKGFETGAGRADSYGMLGMRERAASIGATLEIDSSPGNGARVLCRLDPKHTTQRETI